MTDFVRVRDAVTGHHVSLPREYAEADASRFSILKQPATDVNGRPLPAKHSVNHKTPASAVEKASEAANTEAKKEATR